MTKIGYISTVSELATAVSDFNAQMDNLASYPDPVQHDAKQALARANEWVAMEQADGSIRVGFAKNVGHTGMTLDYYSAHRALPQATGARINGSEAARRIRGLGGQRIGIGWATKTSHCNGHPAVNAVQDFCRRFGKQPSAKAEVLFFPYMVNQAEERGGVNGAPEVFAILLAAINAAGLSEGALDHLFARAKAAAVA